MPRPAVNGRLSLLACLVLVCLTLFWRLGVPSFWDPDEAHYAETSKEMLERGDWLAPMYNGQPFFDKPIFFHWMQGTAMALGGATPGPARFAGALAGALLVAATWWLGRRMVSAEVGTLAALLLAVNPGLFGLARYAILDAPFTLALFSGVGLLVVAALQQRARLEWLGYLAIAAAVCIKGPVALALCGVSLLIACVSSVEARRLLLSLHWIRGVLGIVAVALPWFLYMWWRFDDAFVQGYVLNENITLFSAPPYANQPGWWFYLQILVVGFLPWTGVILERAWVQGRSALAGGKRPDLFDVMLWSWVAGVLIFFSASQFKLDHYILPTAPALCLILARALTESTEEPTPGARRTGIRSVGPLLIAAGSVVGYLAISVLNLSPAFLIVPAALVVLGGATAWQARRGRLAMPSFAIGAMAAFYIGAIVFVFPRLEEGKVIPDVAQWVQTHAADGDRIATFRLNRWNPAFRFYVSRPVTMIDADADIHRFFADKSSHYCVMTVEWFELLKQAGVPLEAVYQRDGIWITSGRALWRTKGSPTTFIVARRAG